MILILQNLKISLNFIKKSLFYPLSFPQLWKTVRKN